MTRTCDTYVTISDFQNFWNVRLTLNFFFSLAKNDTYVTIFDFQNFWNLRLTLNFMWYISYSVWLWKFLKFTFDLELFFFLWLKIGYISHVQVKIVKSYCYSNRNIYVIVFDFQNFWNSRLTLNFFSLAKNLLYFSIPFIWSLRQLY